VSMKRCTLEDPFRVLFAISFIRSGGYGLWKEATTKCEQPPTQTQAHTHTHTH